MSESPSMGHAAAGSNEANDIRKKVFDSLKLIIKGVEPSQKVSVLFTEEQRLLPFFQGFVDPRSVISLYVTDAEVVERLGSSSSVEKFRSSISAITVRQLLIEVLGLSPKASKRVFDNQNMEARWPAFQPWDWKKKNRSRKYTAKESTAKWVAFWAEAEAELSSTSAKPATTTKQGKTLFVGVKPSVLFQETIAYGVDAAPEPFKQGAK